MYQRLKTCHVSSPCLLLLLLPPLLPWSVALSSSLSGAKVVVVSQNLMVGAAEYGQSARVRSIGVSDVQTQGSKMRLKLMCFALTARTRVSLYFGGSE